MVISNTYPQVVTPEIKSKLVVDAEIQATKVARFLKANGLKKRKNRKRNDFSDPLSGVNSDGCNLRIAVKRRRLGDRAIDVCMDIISSARPPRANREMHPSRR